MTQILNKESIITILKDIHPDAIINDDCASSIIQMVTPFNDLFKDKTEDECIKLINTYFGESIVEFTISRLNLIFPLISMEETIIKCLISKLLEISGDTAGAPTYAAYVKGYAAYGVKLEETVPISVYNLYCGLLDNVELQDMFSAYLIPSWIIKGYIYSHEDIQNYLSYTQIIQICNHQLIRFNYEDKVLWCICNLIIGFEYIYDLLHKGDNTIGRFISELSIMIPIDEPIPTRAIQRQVLSLILKSLKSRLGNKQTVTFVDLVWIIKNNSLYSTFIDYIQLLDNVILKDQINK